MLPVPIQHHSAPGHEGIQAFAAHNTGVHQSISNTHNTEAVFQKMNWACRYKQEKPTTVIYVFLWSTIYTLVFVLINNSCGISRWQLTTIVIHHHPRRRISDSMALFQVLYSVPPASGPRHSEIACSFLMQLNTLFLHCFCQTWRVSCVLFGYYLLSSCILLLYNG